MQKNENPSIGRLIARIHRGIYYQVADRLKDKELDVGQFFFLRYILANKGRTQEQIGRSMMLDKATVSKAIKRLIQLGYVYREVNTEDKREYKIFATKEAETLSPEIEVIYNEIYDRLHNNLLPEEVGMLKSLLIKIYRNFE